MTEEFLEKNLKDKTLGEVLFYLRSEHLKLSLRKASELIGISHNYLSILEKGFDPRNNRPVQVTPEILKKISAAYEYPIEELLFLAGFNSTIEEDKSVINIKELLLSSKVLILGDKVLSPEDKRKLLIIAETLMS
ncbi:helix-turn-helix transcriptional regulator [Bacillus sp. FJAT-49736]|uniref:helix-turn-helix domain-containing protein n=1 Tax=Bacillus sp. FJAT-49736 TaxID=2833582 RepID=UPI001BC8DD2C|nr:helix-turn-helix transcriptional regulator [Bacillus sp. FJAT-49736]MBS4174308.1 helix-turn-helix domain-containing protein [Bacillus sp. FJAT-49736]